MSSSLSVILWGVPKPTDGPSPSGFCQKLEAYLRWASVSYTHGSEPNPSKAPKGKVPFADVTLDGKTERLSDSTFIIRHLIAKGSTADPDADAGLTAVQRADSRAWQAWLEELIYPAIVTERWIVDANWATTKQEVFGSMPWPLRVFLPWMLRRRITGLMWAQGVGRHSQAEREGIVAEFVDALETKLSASSGPYFHGEKMSMFDITAASFIANSLGTKGNPYFAGLVLKSPTLVSFARRINAELFPEFKGVLKLLDDAQGELQKKAA